MFCRMRPSNILQANILPQTDEPSYQGSTHSADAKMSVIIIPSDADPDTAFQTIPDTDPDSDSGF